MFGLTTIWILGMAVGVTLAESPSSKSGATSYSVYHRKYEPSEGSPKSVSYSTRLSSKFSAANPKESYSKDPPNSFSKGATGSSKESTSFSSGSSFSGGSSYSKPGPNYSNDGPPSKSNFNGSPNAPKDAPNYSGETYRDSSNGPNYDDGPAYDAAPHPNEPAPPVYNDPPNDVVPYNSPSNYSPPGPVPQYDGPPIPPVDTSFPINSHPIPNLHQPHIPSYDSPYIPSYNSPSIPQYNSPQYNSHQFNPNIPSFNPPQIPSFNSPHIPSYNSPHIPSVNPGQFSASQIPSYNPSFNHYSPQQSPINFGAQPQYNFPRSNSQFQIPLISHGSIPNQFSYPVDRSAHQFSSPLKLDSEGEQGEHVSEAEIERILKLIDDLDAP